MDFMTNQLKLTEILKGLKHLNTVLMLIIKGGMDENFKENSFNSSVAVCATFICQPSQSIILIVNLTLEKSSCDNQYINAPRPTGSGHSKISNVKDCEVNRVMDI